MMKVFALLLLVALAAPAAEVQITITIPDAKLSEVNALMTAYRLHADNLDPQTLQPVYATNIEMFKARSLIPGLKALVKTACFAVPASCPPWVASKDAAIDAAQSEREAEISDAFQ